MDKQFKLTPDQFDIDAEGKIVIATDEIANGVRQSERTEMAPPEEAIKISIEL